MQRRFWTILITIPVLAGLTTAQPADAQIWKKLKKTVAEAAGEETRGLLDKGVRDLVRGAVGCVFDDLQCIRSAEDAGEKVVLTDPEGNLLTDDDGAPITDPEQAAAKASIRPGEGAWANYDFVPGDRVVFAEDFTVDEVGDFPRRLEFVRGGMELVEWRGRKLLRVAANDSRFGIALPEDLPERFTLEFDAYVGHPNAPVIVTTYQPGEGKRFYVSEQRPYFFFDGAAGHTSGIHRANQGVASAEDLRIGQELVAIRVMVDGEHAKVYMNERRLANHPRVELERTDRIYLSFPDIWTDQPVLVGPIRIAAGGKALYEALAADGRVATRGIFFDTGSSRIKPESTPTLAEIGAMLLEHADLAIRIEGHTDSVGEDEYNLDLSRRRAESVRRFLVKQYSIDDTRLDAEGLGETKPVDTNDTVEGRQNNRRVELARVGGR